MRDVASVLQIARLEADADHALELEWRVEAAEAERDEALERARVFTPRPSAAFVTADPPLNPAAATALAAAIEHCR